MWLCGLDLGQASDYTAFSAIERDEGLVYRCRQLQRFKLGMAYTAQVAQVVTWLSVPPLVGCNLVVDHTGVGRAVVDLIRERNPPVTLVPITITAGQDFTSDRRGGYHVPKKDLVTALNLVMQQQRFKVAPQLPLAETLTTELANFRVKVTKDIHEQFGAWRDGEHDDLVLSIALAIWWSEAQQRYWKGVVASSDGLAAYAPDTQDKESGDVRDAGTVNRIDALHEGLRRDGGTSLDMARRLVPGFLDGTEEDD